MDPWIPVVSAFIGGVVGVGGTWLAQGYGLKRERMRLGHDQFQRETEYRRGEMTQAYVDLLVAFRQLYAAGKEGRLERRVGFLRRRTMPTSLRDMLTEVLTSAVARVELIGGEQIQSSIAEIRALGSYSAMPDPKTVWEIQERFVAAVKAEAAASKPPKV